jgi:very-short-patch-repair endonuclease
MTDYETKNVAELKTLCKEKGIKGYASKTRTKATLVRLLKEFDMMTPKIISEYDKYTHDELLNLCKERNIAGYKAREPSGKIISTKKKLIKLLTENNCTKTVFQYFTDNNPLMLIKFVGDQNDLKIVSHGTNKKFTWKCDNIECSNTYKQSPYNIYRQDFPRKYCDICSHQNRYKNKQIAIMKRSGSIEDKFPFIKDIWSNENKKASTEFCPGSNENVKLKCPNKSANHPDYKIDVCKIQEHNCFRCPKCVTKSSNAEMRIYSELKYSFKDVKWQQKIEGREADVTIEDLKLVIEIDGFPWHKNKSEKDLAKNAVFEKNGYTVLRIRDPRLETIVCDTIVCNLTDLSLIEYNKIIDWINIQFKCSIVNYDEWKNTEYYKEIQVSKMSIKYEESIEHLFPESKDLWDYDKNIPFIPSQFSQGSHVEMWVKCSSGHSWKRHLSHLFRTIKGKKHIMKCPECHKPKSNKRIIQINGKTYKSILEWCRQNNIDNNILYKKLKQNNIDISLITNIENFIEEYFKVDL